MKSIEEMRKEFEETETFDGLNVDGYIFFDLMFYTSNLEDLHSNVVALNGAFAMFQELNK